jgi:hypothetical protein
MCARPRNADISAFIRPVTSYDCESSPFVSSMSYPYNLALAAGLVVVILSCGLALVLA